MSVTVLSPAYVEDIVTTMCDAFHDYPVMQYVLGSAPAYDERLRVLVGLFVSARAFRNEPLLAVRDADGIPAAAVVTLPETQDPPAAFIAKRESVWGELGYDARARYEGYISAAQACAIEPPHHHLNMLGVRRSHQGRGLARVLLAAVHDLSSSHAVSAGVSLTTEHPANLALYEHFGYRLLGHARVADSLETWTLFRPRQ